MKNYSCLKEIAFQVNANFTGDTWIKDLVEI